MGTRKLGRPTAHRMSMLNGMVTYLLENGKIETTLTRAKDVSALADKMITLGKKGGLANYRKALAVIPKKEVARKVFDTIAPAFADCNGGYTVVYKMGPRRGDGAEMALITLKGYAAPAVTEVENTDAKATETTEAATEDTAVVTDAQ
ncbi:MAG: 50S ribosomal protein L17 [Clostridia bacterium]|nr:50S ribosomal protein L17 [Clostridia bacterium]